MAAVSDSFTRGQQVAAVMADPPPVHGTDAGPLRVWASAQDLYEFMARHVESGWRTLETGCGISTALFALWGAEHTCVVIAEQEVEILRAWAQEKGIDLSRVRFVVGPSDRVLPGLEATELDLVLIDGSHGFPAPIIDWFYGAGRLRAGGIVVVDDMNLPHVRLGLGVFLEHDRRWERLHSGDLWMACARHSTGPLREEWEAQPFITDELAPWVAPSAVGLLPPQTRRAAVIAFADELMETPTLLAAFVKTFTDADDVTLILYAPAADGNAVATAVARAAEQMGVDLASGPDVVVFATPGDQYSQDQLLRHCRAIFSEVRTRALYPALPVFGAADLALLRDFSLGTATVSPIAPPWSYGAAVTYLVARHGIPEGQVREGSIPEASVQSIVDWVRGNLPSDRPLRALHVGNFIGVSLGHLFAGLRAVHPESLVLSVDPNIPHRGVEHPQDVVIDLLEHFGMHDGHLLVCGYSLEKSVSNDGVVTYTGYDPSREFANEQAPDNTLAGLLAAGLRFDVALIDGNHEPDYLRREVAAISQLLRPGGVLALDDVDVWWRELAAVFTELIESDEWPFEQAGYDGRVGLLRRL
jgi:predicted O-methyltransferase YrrM